MAKSIPAKAFCFFAVIPYVLDFLFQFNIWLNISIQPRLTEYVSFIVVLPVMFGRSFLADSARADVRERWVHHVRSLPRRIVGPVGGVIARDSVVGELKYIRCPTLVVTADEDQTTPPAEAERIARLVTGARLLRLPACGHTSAVEAPAAVNQALLDFYAEIDGKAGGSR